MTHASPAPLEHRQRTILGALFFSPGEAVSVRTLRDTLETTHGELHRLDSLRAELIRLQDCGAVDLKADLVRLTDYGHDAYRGRIELPGWG
jgi:hypothetical protein